MRYFPIFLDLNQKPVLVIGAGEVACRKVEMLCRAGALVTIISPKIHPSLVSLLQLLKDQCQWRQASYHKKCLDGFVQVWATTNNHTLNHQIYLDAKEKNILVNVVDDPKHCDFITPALVDRGRIQVAISSGGASPVLARIIKSQLEVSLPQNLSQLADFAAHKRQEIQQKFASIDQRRIFWQTFFQHLALTKKLVADDPTHEAKLEATYQSLLQSLVENNQFAEPQIYWLEFGNDLELMTLKALRLLQTATLLLHPDDCDLSVLDFARRDAKRYAYQSIDEALSFLDKQDEVDVICVLVEQKRAKGSSALMKQIRFNPKFNWI